MPGPGNSLELLIIFRHEIFMDHETGYVGLRGTVMSGAIAGLCGWSVAIPFDVVKNRHQVIYIEMAHSGVKIEKKCI